MDESCGQGGRGSLRESDVGKVCGDFFFCRLGESEVGWMDVGVGSLDRRLVTGKKNGAGRASLQ